MEYFKSYYGQEIKKHLAWASVAAVVTGAAWWGEDISNYAYQNAQAEISAFISSNPDQLPNDSIRTETLMNTARHISEDIKIGGIGVGGFNLIFALAYFATEQSIRINKQQLSRLHIKR